MWHGTGSNAMEMEPLFLAAVVDGLFGVKPWFGDNLLVLRPAPLANWNDLELDHLDAHYRFHRDAEQVVLEVNTPLARRARAELPVARGVQSVLLDGAPVKFSVEPAVGNARVLIEAPAAKEHRFEVRLEKDKPNVLGPLQVVVGATTAFSVSHASVIAVHDLQNVTSDIRVAPAGDAGATVSFVCSRPGKPTVFLELQQGEVKWLHPLDLDARQPWTIVERCRPPLNPGPPSFYRRRSTCSSGLLKIELANGMTKELAGGARVTVAGRTTEQEVILRPSGPTILSVALGDVWDRLSPGSVPVTVEMAGRKETASAVCWEIGNDANPPAARMQPLDLRTNYNAQMDKLFSPATQWRIDYTGAQHGVDRRHPLPLKDERGWVLMNSVMSVLEPYGNLQEQCLSNGYLKLNKPDELPARYAGIPVRVEPNRLLAVCCTQPYEQFPSRVTLKLPAPCRAEKLYLLHCQPGETAQMLLPGGRGGHPLR